MKLISIKNISKIYHTKSKEICALKDLTFDINSNEILTIIGTSGCGKSTLLNILTKLELPTKGNIYEHKLINIGYMMQTDLLLPWKTVYENSILGLKIQNKMTKDNIEYVNSLLKKYDLYDFRNEYPNNLSGGMRQRVALIRTLALKPNLLLLDEPFSKLDMDSKIMITDDVYKIIKELKITTILITHDIGEALSISDRIIILSSRPGHVKEIVIPKLDESLPSIRRNNSNYNNYYNLLWEKIDHVT